MQVCFILYTSEEINKNDGMERTEKWKDIREKKSAAKGNVW